MGANIFPDAAHIAQGVAAACAMRWAPARAADVSASRSWSCFDVDGWRVTLAHEPATQQVVMRCGAPSLPATEAVMRRLLEHNLDDPRRRVLLGLEAASGQVEATLGVPAYLLFGQTQEAGAAMLGLLLGELRRAGVAPGHLGERAPDDDPAEATAPPSAIEANLSRASRLAWRALRVELAGDCVELQATSGAGAQVEHTLHCVVDGVTVAVQYDLDADTIGFYADLGLPEEDGAMPFLRCLLELNSSQTQEPIRFGLHRLSGRAVAFVCTPALMLGAPDRTGRETLLALVAQARRLRGDG